MTREEAAATALAFARTLLRGTMAVIYTLWNASMFMLGLMLGLLLCFGGGRRR